jgi:hypothetical protein
VEFEPPLVSVSEVGPAVSAAGVRDRHVAPQRDRRAARVGPHGARAVHAAALQPERASVVEGLGAGPWAVVGATVAVEESTKVEVHSTETNVTPGVVDIVD